VRAVVIDSGVDSNNPDLPNVDVLGPNFYAGIPPGDGWSDDEPLGHGTSVCGMISAPANDAAARDTNVADVSGAARITSIKLGNSSQQFYVADAMGALDWVYAQVPDCRVLTLAFAFPHALPNHDLKLFLIRLWRRGVLIVGSSCNDDGGTLPQPAAYAPYVYAVGAFDWRGNHWRDVHVDWDANFVPLDKRPSPMQGSTAGATLQVTGPGGRYIQTTKKGSSRIYTPIGGTAFGFGGTSAATAAVAGGAAHLCSYLLGHGRPVAGEDLAAILNLTAHNIGLPGWDPETGHGLIHLGDALRMVQPIMRFEHGLALDPILVGAPPYLIGQTAWIPNEFGTLTRCDSITRYPVRLRGAFLQPFASTPAVWARSAASVGFQQQWIPGAIIEPGSVWAPWVEVVSASADNITMETYVFTLGRKGTAIEVWFPDDWTFAAGAYTAVGVSPGVGAEPAGDAVVGPGLRGEPVPARHFVDLSFPSRAGTVPVVAIFDIHGRLIRQVRLSRGDGAVSTARWDLHDDTGARVSPRVYFARLRAGRQVLTTRLVVLR
jgi:hypothetical protein